jgi:hypothetical protein
MMILRLQLRGERLSTLIARDYENGDAVGVTVALEVALEIGTSLLQL